MQAMSYQRIWTSLHKGVYGTAMPRWENTLTDTQFKDVIVYVFSLTAPTTPSAAASPQNPTSGGVNQYNNGIQNIPKPITPAINGNPAAPTSTAPPSSDSASPMAGGTSVNPPLNPAPAAPTPGSDTSRGSGAAPGPGSGNGGGAGGRRRHDVIPP